MPPRAVHVFAGRDVVVHVLQALSLHASNVKLDDYTKAHLTESSARIGKVLDAKMDIRSPQRFSLIFGASPDGGGQPAPSGR